jgi:hypothetical protein
LLLFGLVTNLPLSGHRVQGHPLLLVEFGDVASRSGFLFPGHFRAGLALTFGPTAVTSRAGRDSRNHR